MSIDNEAGVRDGVLGPSVLLEPSPVSPSEPGGDARAPDAVMLPAPRPAQEELPSERELYQREVRALERGTKVQSRTMIVQAAATVLTVVATAIAALAAMSASDAVDENRRGVDAQISSAEREVRDNRLATAITAFSEDSPSSRIGGATLLLRDIEDRLARLPVLAGEAAQRPEEPDRRRTYLAAVRDTVTLYGGTLDILENHLRDPARTSVLPAGAPLPVLGAGRPIVPAEVSYIDNRLVTLLAKGKEILSWQHMLDDADVSYPRTSIDLSRAQLYGSPLPAVDVSWLTGKYFRGVDLRSAALAGSNWSGAALGRAYLQCADLGPREGVPARLVGTDLAGADLRGANLAGAVLRDADLSDTDLRGANLEGADLTGATVDRTLFAGSFGAIVGQPALSRSGRGDRFSSTGCSSRSDMDSATPTRPGEPVALAARLPMPEDAWPRVGG